MTNRLLNSADLFQGLLTRDLPDTYEVASDLDVDAFELIPFVTHSAVIAQNGNAPGVWSGTLTINLFLDPASAPAKAALVYSTIHAWNDDPETTIVPDVGAIETIEDLSAFVPVSGEVLMNNKAVRHYQGAFDFTARIH